MHQPQVDNAFIQLVQQNSGIIYKICNAYCGNKHDREDLAQEIIYQLWKAGKSFNHNYKFSTWMYRVALNTAISFYRAQSKVVATVAIHENDVDVEDTGSGGYGTDENIAMLQKYISNLKELDRALMILYLEAKPYSEIAEITGLTQTNVATKIGRIKEKLKQKFLTANK
jgi:RNA polymerase sigma-70 factor (ECF subfamily)